MYLNRLGKNKFNYSVSFSIISSSIFIYPKPFNNNRQKYQQEKLTKTNPSQKNLITKIK